MLPKIENFHNTTVTIIFHKLTSHKTYLFFILFPRLAQTHSPYHRGKSKAKYMHITRLAHGPQLHVSSSAG